MRQSPSQSVPLPLPLHSVWPEDGADNAAAGGTAGGTGAKPNLPANLYVIVPLCSGTIGMLSRSCVLFLSDMLDVRPELRLGTASRRQSLQSHAWFRSFSLCWDDLLLKKTTPPFIPQLSASASGGASHHHHHHHGHGQHRYRGASAAAASAIKPCSAAAGGGGAGAGAGAGGGTSGDDAAKRISSADQIKFKDFRHNHIINCSA